MSPPTLDAKTAPSMVGLCYEINPRGTVLAESGQEWAKWLLALDRASGPSRLRAVRRCGGPARDASFGPSHCLRVRNRAGARRVGPRSSVSQSAMCEPVALGVSNEQRESRAWHAIPICHQPSEDGGKLRTSSQWRESHRREVRETQMSDMRECLSEGQGTSGWGIRAHRTDSMPSGSSIPRESLAVIDTSRKESVSYLSPRSRPSKAAGQS